MLFFSCENFHQFFFILDNTWQSITDQLAFVNGDKCFFMWFTSQLTYVSVWEALFTSHLSSHLAYTCLLLMPVT